MMSVPMCLQTTVINKDIDENHIVLVVCVLAFTNSLYSMLRTPSPTPVPLIRTTGREEERLRLLDLRELMLRVDLHSTGKAVAAEIKVRAARALVAAPIHLLHGVSLVVPGRNPLVRSICLPGRSCHT